MPSTVVVGMQWGDEGKGKIVDLLAEHHDMAVRFNGGANAGHTVKVGSDVYKLHLLPSGIIQGLPSVIANGVVLDPEILIEEMNIPGIDTKKIYISDRAHLVMPQHKAIEAEFEDARGSRIGTTRKAIGPTYAAKAFRTGARVGDLIDSKGRITKDVFWKTLQADPYFDILDKTYGRKLSRDDILGQYVAFAEKMRHNVTDTSLLISEYLESKKSVLFEGAQACMLDIDHGTYPFVTSSNATVGGALTGTGVGFWPDRVVGVTKAYTTRVGGGPFPTEFASEDFVRLDFPSSEQLNSMGKTIQQYEKDDFDEGAELDEIRRGSMRALSRYVRVKGGEYGATTGRPRRGGWFDGVVSRHAVKTNGITEIALMKIDVLSGIHEIHTGTEYWLGDKQVDYVPGRITDFEACRPSYYPTKGWDGDISGALRFSDLPEQAGKYIDDLQSFSGRPINIISVGPERDQTIYRK